MAKISKIVAREILSSASLPSIEVKCVLHSGVIGIHRSLTGLSAGSREAFILLDNDKSRFSGKGT